jgi:undecaprenyl diphosphate synthase
MKKNIPLESEKSSIIFPETIGVIMDGNRRYATEQGLSKLQGHNKGYKKLQEFLLWCKRTNKIRTVIVYAFSTENWNRSESEISDLLGLLEKVLYGKSLHKKDMRIRIAGDISRFSKSLQKKIREIEKETSKNTVRTLVIALSYGGQDEILSAINTLLKKNTKSITKEDLEKEMWIGDMYPDMILRTGGEMRLSNFLPWQSVYSELFFTPTLWPALSAEEFSDILIEYSKRKRNFGK